MIFQVCAANCGILRQYLVYFPFYKVLTYLYTVLFILLNQYLLLCFYSLREKDKNDSDVVTAAN